MVSLAAHTSMLRQYAHGPLIAWALYLFLVPLYVFKSGLPQPGDLYVVALVPIVLRGWNGRLQPRVARVARTLLWFTLWVFAVDWGWAIVLGKFGAFGADTFIIYPLFYLYNALIFLVAVVLHMRYDERFLRVTLYTLYATIIVQVLASFVYRIGGRGALFFNNANQLGYFALLCVCVIVLLHWRLRLRLLVTCLMIVCCGYLAVLSASRSAIGGTVLLLALLMFSSPRVIVGVMAFSLMLLFAGGPIAKAVDAAERRVMKRSTHGFVEERRYDRIWEHKEYILLGAGEGGLSRFEENPKARGEIHSSAGTVLFSYGIVGSVLFLVFVWQVVRRARWRMSLVLLPPLFYSFAHQGLRFTLLWVLFAMFVVLKGEAAAPRLGAPSA